MVRVVFDSHFRHTVKKIKDGKLKERIKKQIRRILKNPETCKPMRYTRKDTREVHIPSFRLSYLYLREEDKIVFLEIYHKDKQ
jgi:mRNA-degrading endonuclease RelE of RelBE toxin-antitoxin system